MCLVGRGPLGLGRVRKDTGRKETPPQALGLLKSQVCRLASPLELKGVLWGCWLSLFLSISPGLWSTGGAAGTATRHSYLRT